jgi:plastin-1
VLEKLRGIHEVLSEEEISRLLSETYPDMNQSIEFEPFLKVQRATPAQQTNSDFNISLTWDKIFV